MKYAWGAGQMKAIDRYTIETVGIPSCVLMEKAALAVAHHAEKLCEKNERILTAKENREILQRQIPEAILTTYDTLEDGISPEDALNILARMITEKVPEFRWRI